MNMHYKQGLLISEQQVMDTNPLFDLGMHYKQGLLISEQQVTDTNPLFDLAVIPHDLQATSPNSSSQPVAQYTHATG
jgi:hypothetical protein